MVTVLVPAAVLLLFHFAKPRTGHELPRKCRFLVLIKEHSADTEDSAVLPRVACVYAFAELRGDVVRHAYLVEEGQCLFQQM